MAQEFTSRFGKVEKDFESKFIPTEAGFSSNFAPEPETTIGGLTQSVGAGVAAGFTAPGRFLGAGLEVAEDITGIDLFGSELTDVSKFAQVFWQKRIGKSKAEQLVGQASEALGTIASSLAVVAATGGAAGAGGATTFTAGAQAAAGSQALLFTLSAGAGLDKTATERREGTPVLNAYGAGVVTAATEYITEKIPLGKLQNIGNKFFRRLAEGAIADVGGEMLATAVELSITDKRILNKDHHLTTDQYLDIMKETAIVAMISTVGMSASAKALQLTSDTADAQNSVTPPPNPLLLPPKEKVEITPDGELVRTDSKSEFPEHSKQTDPVSPDVNFEMNESTTPEPQDINDPSYKRPRTTFEETQDKSRAYSIEKRKLTGSKIWKSFVRSWVDVSGNLQDALSKFGNDGKRVVSRMNAINGASGEAAPHIDRINKEVYSGLNKDERNLFDDWKAAKRGLELRAARGVDFKLAEGNTEQSLQDFIARVPDKYKEIFNTRNEFYKKGMDDLLQLGFDEGLLTEAQLGSLREAGREYLPREVLDFIDPEIQRQGKGGKTITVRDSGLKNLSEDGTDKLLETDTQLLMEQSQQRMWTRVYRNRAALEMQRLSRTNPNAVELVREAKVVGRTKMLFEITNKKSGKVFEIEAKNIKEALRFLGEKIPPKGGARITKTDIARLDAHTRGDMQLSKSDLAELQNKVLQDKLSPIPVSEQSFKGVKDFVGKNNIIKTKRGSLRIYEKISSDEMSIGVMEDGEMKPLIMPIELGQEWITGDPILSATMSNIIGWVSGNKILKAMATTLNPEFAITNIPRDMSHIWMSTEEYSSIAPLAALQMHTDMAAVLKDALNKTGLYNTYVENGGGMEFLSHRGKLKLKGTNALTKGISGLENVMSKAGEFSETITRLALMRRAKRNGKSDFEATQIARGYLDFARGGSAAKAVNSAVPFFNAGIQATRGIVRAAKGNPMIFGAKAFQVGAMAVGLYYANKKNYPDDYDNVPDYDRENNFIFLTPFTYKDKQGRERRRYFKIPKDQGQKVFATIFENMARRSEGEQVDGIKISNLVKDYLPIVPGEILPPALEMMLGYSTNKDFWLREDIWRGADVLPQEEYNKYTPEFFVAAGKATGSSPERLRYATKQLFTSGNIWTSLVGYGVNEVMKELSPAERERVSEMTLDQVPGVRRIMRSTRPDLAHKKEIEKQKIEANTERLVRNREFDSVTERFFNGNTERKEVREYIRRSPQHERKRLLRRFKTQRKLQGVTNRGYWFDLMDLPPESRAINYWNRWVQLDEGGRRELDRQSRKVPRFRSKRFNKQIRKMRRFGDRGR